jgi:formylglycine-generating enzyme required for sulfatase activity
MADQRSVDVTELSVLGEQFPLRLMQSGFRLIQTIDEQGYDRYQYIIPPVCALPAGPFLMGSDRSKDSQAQDNEMPQHTITLESFEIGAYPLTVAEYACCVQATKCPVPHDWNGQQHHLDRPVVYVTWNSVVAYVQWLAQVTGEGWRLPTEAEWEKAARGSDGRIFPWGDRWDEARANSRLREPQMTPVGSYPGGASPYGANDMAGNVWEWTSTTYKPYPYQTRDGREGRGNRESKVLRGGSWMLEPRYARAASRLSYVPSQSFNALGVRLARSVVTDG